MRNSYNENDYYEDNDYDILNNDDDYYEDDDYDILNNNDDFDFDDEPDIATEWMFDIEKSKRDPNDILAEIKSISLESDDEYHLDLTLDVLDKIKNKAPHLAEEVSSITEAIQNKIVTISPYHSKDIISENPKLAAKALQGIKTKLNEDTKHSGYDITGAYSTLASIIKVNPELFQDAFDLFVKHMKSDNAYYLSIAAIPSLKSIKDTMSGVNQESLSSTKDNNIEKVCTVLSKTQEYCVSECRVELINDIIKDRPDLAELALKKMDHVCDARLAKTIIKANPSLSKALTQHLHESYRKVDSFNDEKIFNLLGDLSKENLDVAKDAFEVIKDIDIDTQKVFPIVIGAKHGALKKFALSSHPELSEQAYEILSKEVLTYQNPYTIIPEVNTLVDIVVQGGDFSEKAFADYKKGIKRLSRPEPAWDGLERIALHAKEQLAQESLGILEDMVASSNDSYWKNTRQKDIEKIKKDRPSLLQNDKEESTTKKQIDLNKVISERNLSRS